MADCPVSADESKTAGGGTGRSRWQHVSTAMSIIAAATVMVVAVLTYRRPSRDTPVPAPVPTQVLHIDDLPTEGSDKAHFVLIEFADFQCPFCRHFANKILPQVRRDYVDPGILQVAFANMPLPTHDFSDKAARAGECAFQQGRFWQIHDALFSVAELSDAAIEKAAVVSGVEEGRFARCFSSAAVESTVRAALANARAVEAQGTPTFFVGVKADGGVRVTSRFMAAGQYNIVKDQLNKVIEAGR